MKRHSDCGVRGERGSAAGCGTGPEEERGRVPIEWPEMDAPIGDVRTESDQQLEAFITVTLFAFL